jgi:hypothetical protein
MTAKIFFFEETVSRMAIYFYGFNILTSISECTLVLLPYRSEPKFVNDSQPGWPVRQPYLTYKPARLHRLAESIPWDGFLGSLFLIRAAIKNCIEWRLQVQKALLAEVYLASSRPE